MPVRLTPFDLMQALVRFPTVSRDSNLPLIDWVETYLTGHGITCHRHLHPDEPKAALFAHVGPEVPGAVVLSGHTDVVPVDGQNWQSDPFDVVERNGRYFGRGTCDMKGFDALAIWALVEAHYAQVPLQLALSYDEEIGCTGAPPLIAAMHAVLPRGGPVIVGEPSMMKTVTGHKGSMGFDTQVAGYEVHSSLLPQGVSAVLEGARIIDFANQCNAENAVRAPSEVAAMFDPPYTTWHVGQVAGGTAHNITAGACAFSMDFRAVPGDDPAMLEARYRAHVDRIAQQMQKVRPETGVEIEVRFDVPALVPEKDGAAEALVRRITGDNARHVVSYGTEAGHFQAAGHSAVVCGPGDIAQAHQPDEFITVAQFEAGHRFMRDLLVHLG